MKLSELKPGDICRVKCFSDGKEYICEVSLDVTQSFQTPILSWNGNILLYGPKMARPFHLPIDFIFMNKAEKIKTLQYRWLYFSPNKEVVKLDRWENT